MGIAAAQLRADSKPLILMYHSIVDYQQDPFNITIRPKRFEQHMRWLHRRGRRCTSVGELVEAWRNNTADGMVGLSFDDGYADFVYNALPVLRRYGFSATLFALGGRLGGHSGWMPQDPAKPLLTAEQIRDLAVDGIEIGSHGLLHQSLPTLEETALVEEIQQSRCVLRDVSGQEVLGFCYPFGHVDERAIRTAQAAGYGYACSVWPTGFTGDYALIRVNMLDGYSAAHLWYKGIRHWLRWEYEGPGSGALVRMDLWRKRRRQGGQLAATVS
jgi:peptidoglycan/xylan/chitin deacetylase (PgdA/CDA1 family)